MSDEVNELKRQYRGIKAPPYLATRIRAEVEGRVAHRRPWLPVVATAAVAAAVIIPLMLQQQSAQPTPRSPSIAMLSQMTPGKPAIPAPSLSKVRSVKTPALPRKPKLNLDKDPQTDIDIQKETDHAYT